MSERWRHYFRQGKAALTTDMQMAVLCREMGWSWQDAMDAPQPFILTAWAMLQEEAKESERKSKSKR